MSGPTPATCFACKKPKSGAGLMAKDRYFHKSCFNCLVCKASLAGARHYLQDGGYYCINDYQKKWGIKCHVCGVYVEGNYTVVGDLAFHNHCFKCFDCGISLAGNRHYSKNGNYYCVTDYQRKWGIKCHTCRLYIVGEHRTAEARHFHDECFKCGWCENLFPPQSQYFVSSDGQDILCSSCSAINKESASTTSTTILRAQKPGSSSSRSSSTSSMNQNQPTVNPKDRLKAEFVDVDTRDRKTATYVDGLGHGQGPPPGRPRTIFYDQGQDQNVFKDNLDRWDRLSTSSFSSQYSLEEKEQEKGPNSSSSSTLSSPTKKPGKLDGSKLKIFENVFEKNIPQGLFLPRAKKKKAPPIPQENTQSLIELDSPTTPSSQSSQSTAAIPSSTSSSECTICYDKPVECVFIPCGHFCVCGECAEDYKTLKEPDLECPICRAPSTGVFKTYKT